MPVLASAADLKAYIRRQLSHSYIKVEVEDAQYTDIIDDTIYRFRERATDGYTEKYLILSVTAGSQEFDLKTTFLGDEVASILEARDATNLFPSMFSTDYIAMSSYMQSTSSFGLGLLDIEIIRQHLQNLEYMLKVMPSYTFNPLTKKLRFHEKFKADKNLLLQTYCYLSATEAGLYNQTWIKRMCVAKARYQWAMNAMKYNGSVLPNGLVFNVDGILNEAKEEMQKCEEQLENEYTEPLDFFVG
jgi:hypothetical protein